MPWRNYKAVKNFAIFYSIKWPRLIDQHQVPLVLRYSTVEVRHIFQSSPDSSHLLEDRHQNINCDPNNLLQISTMIQNPLCYNPAFSHFLALSQHSSTQQTSSSGSECESPGPPISHHTNKSFTIDAILGLHSSINNNNNNECKTDTALDFSSSGYRKTAISGNYSKLTMHDGIDHLIFVFSIQSALNTRQRQIKVSSWICNRER